VLFYTRIRFAGAIYLEIRFHRRRWIVGSIYVGFVFQRNAKEKIIALHEDTIPIYPTLFDKHHVVIKDEMIGRLD